MAWLRTITKMLLCKPGFVVILIHYYMRFQTILSDQILVENQFVKWINPTEYNSISKAAQPFVQF